MLGGCNSTQVDQDIRSGELAVRPPGHAETPIAWEAFSSSSTSAAHRSAAMAGGARPDPFRTRKLSRRAPMVLRGQPVGEQGAADRWTALDPHPGGLGRGGAAGDPPRGAPFLSFHMRPRGPSGAPFHAAGGPGPGPRSDAGRPHRRGPDAFSAPGDSRAPQSRRDSCGPLSRSAVYIPLTSCPATSPAVRLLPPANTLLEFRLG